MCILLPANGLPPLPSVGNGFRGRIVGKKSRELNCFDGCLGSVASDFFLSQFLLTPHEGDRCAETLLATGRESFSGPMPRSIRFNNAPRQQALG